MKGEKTMVLAQKVPGISTSNSPDECGFAAAKFVESVRDSDWATVWMLLSKESRGMSVGVWAERSGRQLRDVYGVADDPSHPLYGELMGMVVGDFTIDWGWKNIQTPAVCPTRYLASNRAWVRVPTKVTEPTLITEPTAMHMLLLPMQFEDGMWRVHFSGFAWPEQPTLEETKRTYRL